MAGGKNMADEFFSLNGLDNASIDDKAFMKLIQEKHIIKNYVYEPKILHSPTEKRTEIRSKQFVNVDFSNTELKNLSFIKCVFRNCLFVDAAIRDSYFTGCEFIACNMDKCNFEHVHVNPRSFKKAIPNKKYSEIAISLYRALVSNSNKEYHPYYADEAQYMLKTWIYINRIGDKENSLIMRFLYWLMNLILRQPFGYGIRLRNLVMTAITLICLFTVINWHFHEAFGIAGIGRTHFPFIDSIYFTITIITTLGFGDITPTTALGEVIVSIQTFIGFAFLGIFSSMLSRKLSL